MIEDGINMGVMTVQDFSLLSSCREVDQWRHGVPRGFYSASVQWSIAYGDKRKLGCKSCAKSTIVIKHSTPNAFTIWHKEEYTGSCMGSGSFISDERPLFLLYIAFQPEYEYK